jgi:hypothetical protein
VTIHAKPITGLGFGQKFYRPIALPDISFFEFYEYIPHNAILWIWMEMGVGGFVAMLFLFGSALRAGTRATLGLMRGLDALVVLTALTYLAMFLVFAREGMGWDAASMVTVAIAAGHLRPVLCHLRASPAEPAQLETGAGAVASHRPVAAGVARLWLADSMTMMHEMIKSPAVHDRGPPGGAGG